MAGDESRSEEESSLFERKMSVLVVQEASVIDKLRERVFNQQSAVQKAHQISMKERLTHLYRSSVT